MSRYGPSPNVTPFIPPLRSPQPSPQPPVVPSPSGGAPLPAWANMPQHAGNYPSTPYTSTPFIPHMTPAMTPGAMPGGYLPPPTAASHHHQQPPPLGVSMDYTGYPQFAQGTPWPAAPPPLQAATPWHGPTSAPLHPMGGPWAAPYPPFQQQPMSAGYPSAGYPAPGPPPGWGQYTPMNPADPWGVHTPAAPPPWAQVQMMQQQQQQQQQHQPQHHQPQHAQQQQHPQQQQLPQHLQAGQGPLGRANAHVGDRVDPFTAGNHYGPVLDPFLIRAIGAQVKLNPLITPLPEDGPDRPHLKWNMLFASNNCQRSTDPGHVSWSNGRQEPVTFPRVTSLRIVSEAFPWMIDIRARNRDVGVTCGELIDMLSDNFHRLTMQSDYDALPTSQKRHLVAEAYRHNRSRAHGVPGGTLGEGMRRLDFFCQDTVFGGIERDDRVVKRICGDVLPCTFVLRCRRRYPMTAQEIRDQEARQRAASRTAGGDRRRSVTVTTVDDDDDDDDD